MLTREQVRQVEIWQLMRPYHTPDFEELAFQRWHWRAKAYEEARPQVLADNRRRYAERYRDDEAFQARNRAQAKAWYDANADRAREAARKRMAERRAQDREGVNAKARAWHAARKARAEAAE
jgi:hypothetical protein